MRLTVEPPSGSYIRARYVDHHTAGYIFHRDDREGHSSDGPEADQHWWFHERCVWTSWPELLDFVAECTNGTLVLELLYSTRPLGCQPDGTHDSGCDN